MHLCFKRFIHIGLAPALWLIALAACADPPTVYDVLRASYPDYEIKDPTLLAARIDSFFGDEIETPTSLAADLDGNGLEDHAFLLSHRVDTLSVLVAYLQTSPSTYEEFELSRGRFAVDYIEEFPPNTVIEAATDEEREALGGPLTLSHSAILGVNYAKSAVVIFWDTEHRAFREISMSD